MEAFHRSRPMVCVYQIHSTPEAPRLEVLDETDAQLLVFDGQRKSAKWPPRGLKVKTSAPPADLFQFYQLAPGVLVYPEQVIEACGDFYWVATQNIEPLHAVSHGAVFNLINIVDFMDPLEPGVPGYDVGAPCNVASFYAPIIKIKGRPPTDMYCISGLGNPKNEFKPVYERYGFKGLVFQTVWQGEP
jgi:hypothetical protein